MLDEAECPFAHNGYGAVGLPTVVAGAGVTTGSPSHQFDGSAALFAAVLERWRTGWRIGWSTRGGGPRPVGAARRRVPGVPRRRTEPSAARIMLVDGPGLLGWGAPARAGRRVVGTAPCRGAGRSRRARGAGAQPVEPLARLLSGAMNEHAMWLAEPGTAHGERDPEPAPTGSGPVPATRGRRGTADRRVGPTTGWR
ncbi:helix-turn-helix domain-containing protein [Pseudonocardia sp. McavD-2-B]|uniref:helix-turn-helix domain-containing protein n=1 Tax=Pseudonocardia sp. McavD-2-B TaxID=2954499 RepID=UPI0035ABC155